MKTESEEEITYDKQIENNTTKALINTLEICGNLLLQSALRKLDVKHFSFSSPASYFLQIESSMSRPDALISSSTGNLFIESKVESAINKKQLLNQRTFLRNLPSQLKN